MNSNKNYKNKYLKYKMKYLLLQKGGADIELPYNFLSFDKSKSVGQGDSITFKDGADIEAGDHLTVITGSNESGGFGREVEETANVKLISINNTDKTVTVLYPYKNGTNKTGVFNFKDIKHFSRPLFREGSQIIWHYFDDGNEIKGEGIIKDMNTKWPNYIITQTV